MSSSTAHNILTLHTNKVPLIISDNSNITLNKTKFIVPRNLSVGQFHCIIKKYADVKSSDCIVLFIDGKLPIITDTIGNLYDLHKQNDDFLYITVSKENAFG